MPLDGVGECGFTGRSFERWWRGWRRWKRQGIGQELDGAWCSRAKVRFVMLSCATTSASMSINMLRACSMFISYSFSPPICPSSLLPLLLRLSSSRSDGQGSLCPPPASLPGFDSGRELFEACRNGDVARVKKLINTTNVNAKGKLFRAVHKHAFPLSIPHCSSTSFLAQTPLDGSRLLSILPPDSDVATLSITS